MRNFAERNENKYIIRYYGKRIKGADKAQRKL